MKLNLREHDNNYVTGFPRDHLLISTTVIRTTKIFNGLNMEKNERKITKEFIFHTVFETSSKSCVKLVFNVDKQGSLFSPELLTYICSEARLVYPQ